MEHLSDDLRFVVLGVGVHRTKNNAKNGVQVKVKRDEDVVG